MGLIVGPYFGFCKKIIKEINMKGFRTLIFNLIVALVPVVGETLAFLNIFDWKSILPSQYAALAILVIGLANIWFRYITTTPIGKKL